jgi:hypothetical protein
MSPDGASVLAASRAGRDMTLMPTGAGTAEALKGGQRIRDGAFLPDGNGIVFLGSGETELRVFVQQRGAEPRPISGEGDFLALTPSPDGRTLAVMLHRKVSLLDVSGGTPRTLPWAVANEYPVGWSADGRSLFMARIHVGAAIDRVDIASGARTPWKTLMPSEPAGVTEIRVVRILDDGRGYAYSYSRRLSQLMVVSGLR